MSDCLRFRPLPAEAVDAVSRVQRPAPVALPAATAVRGPVRRLERRALSRRLAADRIWCPTQLEPDHARRRVTGRQPAQLGLRRAGPGGLTAVLAAAWELSGVRPTVATVTDVCPDDAQSRWLEAIERRAQAWAASVPADRSVGDRHHIVPVMYLRNFAENEQLLVRRIPDHTPRVCNMHDLAQRDFYTVLADDPVGGEPRPDGRIEQILQIVEDAAASVLRLLRNPLLARRDVTGDEHAALVQFLAFQFVRGVRRRREIELLAEYHAKLTAVGRGAGDVLADLEELAKVRVVPHTNEHMRMLGDLAEQAHECLRHRPVCIIELDRPLLFTCDEPVVLVDDDSDDDGHRPECFLTERERRRRRRRAFAAGQEEVSELIHLVPTRSGGLAVAEEVALPLDPRRVLLLGPHGVGGPRYVRITGDEADDIAADINRRVLDQAYLWVAGHPQNEQLRTLTMPEPGPVLRICDGGSPFARTLDEAPEPRHPARFRRD